ncbi:MAG: efflux RND transporter periplasmic adaptor subunit [Chloroflexota bacterium]|nr:MAG: efflux RND transporter periplasmic adaptor subunit [Chloroflexota bacterium]
MLRNRKVWLIGLVLIIIAGGAAAYFAINANSTEAADEEQEMQTSVARQGNIVISATAAGTIVPATEVVLGFPTNGTLSELHVVVGDDVVAGDVLASLDDADAQQALTNAQIQLNQAAMKTDASTTDTGISFDEISIEQARINLAQAQSALDDLLHWEPDEDEIALAESNVEAAEAGYNAAVGQEASGFYGIQTSQISLQQAQAALATAQENYDAAWSEGRDWETQYNEPICDPGEREPCTGQTWAERIERDRESATNALTRAQDNLALAEIDYNRSVSSSSSSSSANAQTSILNAQLALDAALSDPSEDDIEAAETTVRQAELNLKQALLNQESNALSLAQAQLNLEAAQAALDETALLAPMDGTIMAVSASVGESAGAGLITLADLEQPILEVFLDETDMNMVGLGYDVEVIFDALPDDVFEGQVIQIDPQLTNQGGVTAVRALVQLDTDSFAKPQTLPVGMNATVEVIGGRAENAVLVPVEALRELTAGQYAVFVMEDDEPVLRMVEVGLMDFSFAEIVSGLKAGETVTTGIVQTQ